MPRLKKNISTVKRRIETADKYRKYNLWDWVDPYPEIQGTTIEKMIYAKLVRMGVRFIYQGDFPVNIPEIDLFKIYRPDFWLPDVKIIIDPFGSFWHSSPQAIEADSYKFALFEAMGYKTIIWWDYEIEAFGLDVLFARVPELNNYTAPRVVYGGETPVPPNINQRDDLKGLRTLNSRKRKPYKKFIGTSRKKSRKVQSGYAPR